MVRGVGVGCGGGWGWVGRWVEDFRFVYSLLSFFNFAGRLELFEAYKDWFGVLPDLTTSEV